MMVSASGLSGLAVYRSAKQVGNLFILSLHVYSSRNELQMVPCSTAASDLRCGTLGEKSALRSELRWKKAVIRT